MKNVILLFAITCILSSCASYNVAILDNNGKVLHEHKTKKVYVGMNMFIPDAIVGTLGMTASLFYPFPKVESSMGVGGGISVGSHLSNLSSTFTAIPSSIFGGGGSSSLWVTFDDINGNRISYNGNPYKLTRVSKAEIKLSKPLK